MNSSTPILSHSISPPFPVAPFYYPYPANMSDWVYVCYQAIRYLWQNRHPLAFALGLESDYHLAITARDYKQNELGSKRRKITADQLRSTEVDTDSEDETLLELGDIATSGNRRPRRAGKAHRSWAEKVSAAAVKVVNSQLSWYNFIAHHFRPADHEGPWELGLPTGAYLSAFPPTPIAAPPIAAESKRTRRSKARVAVRPSLNIQSVSRSKKRNRHNNIYEDESSEQDLDEDESDIDILSSSVDRLRHRLRTFLNKNIDLLLVSGDRDVQKLHELLSFVMSTPYVIESLRRDPLLDEMKVYFRHRSTAG